MELPVNNFKRALKANKVQIGLWCSLSSHYATELVAGSGFDWILLDTEHSPNDLESVLQQLQAAAPYPTHPVVRVPWNDMVTIKRYLDIGAQSLLIPYVQNAEEAKAAVAYTRYPPPACAGLPERRAPRASDARRTTPSARTRRSACSCRSRHRPRSTTWRESPRSTVSMA